MMARRAHVYPQVEPGAAALITGAVGRLPARATVGAALRVARKRDVLALASGGSFVLREDLARAERLGLEDLRAVAVARPLPTVAANHSEVEVRRALAQGAPAVIVTERGRPVGAATGIAAGAAAPVSMAARLERGLPPHAQKALAIVGALAAERRMRAYLVGGVVRDLWLEGSREAPDLDVVVEGDAPLLAEAIAAALGGTARVHDRFLTASVDAPGVGRIDVVTSRSERYERRGALPRVMPAGIAHDLRRRDFTVNAMAIDLGSPSADLLDPTGARADLERRRLRVLHPLSFVDDPTRIFRAARYAARLGFALDAWSARCQALALGLVPYPALSGQRIVAELERIVADANPTRALALLGRAGAFRLLDPRYRFSARVRARLEALPAARQWARERREFVNDVELTLLALLDDQSADVARAAWRRLGFAGDPLERVERTHAAVASVAARLGAGVAASERVKALAALDGTGRAWLHVIGSESERAALDRALGESAAARPVLRGDDVIGLGVPRGPEVARVLEALRTARVDGRVHDRESEADFVRAWRRAHEARSQTDKEG